jgi:hypothetical protein
MLIVYRSRFQINWRGGRVGKVLRSVDRPIEAGRTAGSGPGGRRDVKTPH